MHLSDDTRWDGLECPKCGCQRLDVYYDRRKNGGRFRMRICANCGRRIPTLELPLYGVRRPEQPPEILPAKVEEPDLRRFKRSRTAAK